MRWWFLDAAGGAATLQEVFDALAGWLPVREARFDVLGRKLVVPMAVANKELGFFMFEELCNRPLAAADYSALCNTLRIAQRTDVLYVPYDLCVECAGN